MQTTFDFLKQLEYVYRLSRKVLSRHDRLRWLGGMEAYLIEMGKIPSGVLGHQYITVEKTFWGVIPYKRIENYEEFILRITREVLNEGNKKNME